MEYHNLNLDEENDQFDIFQDNNKKVNCASQKVNTDENYFSFNASSAYNSFAQLKPKLATINELPNIFVPSKTTDINSKIAIKKSSISSQINNFNVNIARFHNNSINMNSAILNHSASNDLSLSTIEVNRHFDTNSQTLSPAPITPIFKDSKTAKELAVELRNVNYAYGKGKKNSKVLNNVTLRIPLGGIYGLLGPSGCGKTSLLKIIVGRNKPSSGLVRVFGTIPGSQKSFVPGPGVGYMPQELSLFNDLTVAETLVFFSKIYRMKSHLVLERIEFLLKLLDLEEKGNVLVSKLSGGQKRRVSLASALVHSPPLVILDEPTVGVDPLLRIQIWNYLVRLARDTKLTVLITTHYIEEARQANTVGLMRFGRILIESQPSKLIRKYKENNLEDVFLKICMMDEKEFGLLNDNYEDEDEDDKSQVKLDRDSVKFIPDKTKESSSNKALPQIVVSEYELLSSKKKIQHMNQDENEIETDKNQDDDKHESKDEMLSKNENTTQNIFIEQKKDALPHNENRLEANKKCSPSLQTVQIDEKVNLDSLNEQERVRHNSNASSLGESIIEYDSATFDSKSSCSQSTPCKLATLNSEFQQKFEPQTTIKNNMKNSCLKIGALFFKNITNLRRNLPLLLFQFFLPSLEIILFSVCIGADPFNIPVAIFNQDVNGSFSSLFLNSLDNHTIIQHHFNALPNAINAVREGKAWGAVAIKKNFSLSIVERHLMGSNADNKTLDESNIYIFLDMTNQLIGYKLQRSFLEAFQTFSRKQLIESNQNPGLAELPIKIGKPIYGDREPTFTEFMAPGVVLTIAFLATVALTALAFVIERKEGIMERVLVAGVTPFEFLMSHIVTQVCVIVVQVALLLIFTFLVFDVPSRGPFIWVILLTMLQAFCGMKYGLLISSLCENETAATMLALGSFYPNLLLSGTVWPTQAMPDFMRWFSYFLPQTLPIESMRYILSRGWDPSYFDVSLGFLVTFIWSIFFMVATLWAFNKIK